MIGEILRNLIEGWYLRPHVLATPLETIETNFDRVLTHLVPNPSISPINKLHIALYNTDFILYQHSTSIATVIIIDNIVPFMHPGLLMSLTAAI